MNSSLPWLASVPLPGPRERNDTTFHWVILFICSGVLISAVLLAVGDSGVVVPGLNRRLPELCMLRRVTGLSCPGCGLTRCFISLAHGDVSAAWSFNPAGLWLFAIIVAQLPLRCYQLWRINHGRRELQLAGVGAIAFGVFLVVLLTQWALRLASAYL
ncbi:MAG TPA: DUF2752 domain-containing protein [Pirellulaceae bacterium]|jgi:hypothetical protein